MASWSQNHRSGLESVRCPVHGPLVVRRASGAWLMRCETCLLEAATAIGRMLLRLV